MGSNWLLGRLYGGSFATRETRRDNTEYEEWSASCPFSVNHDYYKRKLRNRRQFGYICRNHDCGHVERLSSEHLTFDCTKCGHKDNVVYVRYGNSQWNPVNDGLRYSDKLNDYEARKLS